MVIGKIKPGAKIKIKIERDALTKEFSTKVEEVVSDNEILTLIPVGIFGDISIRESDTVYAVYFFEGKMKKWKCNFQIIPIGKETFLRLNSISKAENANARNGYRIQCLTEAFFTSDKDKKVYPGTIKNISVSGVLFKTKAEIRQGKEFNLSIKIKNPIEKDKTDTVKMFCSVVRVEKSEDNDFEYGLSFTQKLPRSLELYINQKQIEEIQRLRR